MLEKIVQGHYFGVVTEGFFVDSVRDVREIVAFDSQAALDSWMLSNPHHSAMTDELRRYICEELVYVDHTIVLSVVTGATKQSQLLQAVSTVCRPNPLDSLTQEGLTALVRL